MLKTVLKLLLICLATVVITIFLTSLFSSGTTLIFSTFNFEIIKWKYVYIGFFEEILRISILLYFLRKLDLRSPLVSIVFCAIVISAIYGLVEMRSAISIMLGSDLGHCEIEISTVLTIFQIINIIGQIAFHFASIILSFYLVLVFRLLGFFMAGLSHSLYNAIMTVAPYDISCGTGISTTVTYKLLFIFIVSLLILKISSLNQARASN